MSAQIIEPIAESDFKAFAESAERALTLKLEGNADLNVKSSLDKFLSAVHEVAAKYHLHEVTVDVRRLEFMNSSCLKCFVTWLSKIQTSAPSEHYNVSFVSSPTLYWQKRSLNALACLAPEMVTVQVGG
jgi:hypothetical protein